MDCDGVGAVATWSVHYLSPEKRRNRHDRLRCDGDGNGAAAPDARGRAAYAQLVGRQT